MLNQSSIVRFPGFGISVEVSKIAFTIFGINIYSYAVCIVFGMIFALILCYKSEERFHIRYEYVLDRILPAIVIGVLGARIYYILFNLDYYFKNPVNIFRLRDGGLAIYGGLIAGEIYIVKKCKKDGVNVLDFFDYLIPYVALAQSIGRWGNFFNQEAYGIETKSIFRMGITTIDGYKEVHPAFLYESICTLIIFMFLKYKQSNRKFKGEIFYLYLILYSGIRILIENIRMDSLMLENFRISQILSVAIFVVSGIMLLKKFIKYKVTEKN